MRGLSSGCSSSSAKVQKKIGRAQEGTRMGEVTGLEGMAVNVFYILTKNGVKHNNNV